MLKKIGFAVVALIVALVAVISFQPDTFAVERSTVVAAPLEVVYPYANDFKQWDRFSPWNKLDPAIKKEFGGPATGVGSWYTWVGNDDVGSGKMTILESSPTVGAKYKLEFFAPFAATNESGLLISADGANTRITWTMSGKSNFMSKAFGLVMDMDAMIGKDFAEGLATLKTLAEADAKALEQKKADEAKAAAAAAEAAAAEAAAEPTDAPTDAEATAPTP